MNGTPFHPLLQKTIESFLPELSQISEERRAFLKPLTHFVSERVAQDKAVALNFICTHNSRRSHLGQIWASVAATHYRIPKVACFSGGTEATAFNPRAVAAIERDGLQVLSPGGENPHYVVSLGPALPTLTCFSKTYDNSSNPSGDFAAIMTCNHADKNCPAVLGAARISLPYVDPKEADNTALEATRYSERSRQIAIEMFAAFEALKR